ncbi:4-hydroxybenzoate polyprenyltransferase [Vespertiliibacter pulmonis]|uniref:4-hydroxybenzoate octaprenyltransferase n=1 Tax=Vespertiliibacter pulmonis TaxID=1443036 RepID=A0A3N4WMJ5_9PAST|nr:4-hydroxybenzoate octaprenyltransferase [Vespertiliibacter pulmonis]QLB20328.1 4-hydroxybenzoate polyprenyltransferase [Vespertiliibacter pulmonis]RPE86314.1 4-hydroxybenzoate polyprenyltransferase [Vespertiliibacter pulmonis]
MKQHFTPDKRLAYLQLMRMDKPIGTLLLLWPTFWALFTAANGIPPLSILIIFTLGVIVMRSAGCVINDYADRHFDGEVKRTANRPLATGRVTELEAKVLFAVLIGIAFCLVLMLNYYTIILSFIAVGLACIYPFMKRFTHLPQLVLGVAFGWSIPMAFGAVEQSLPIECWLLFLANLMWTVAYDTQYAMVDRDDDLRIGVKSTAILFAQYDNKIIALLQFLALVFLVMYGYLSHFDISYYIALAITATLFIYQCKLTKTREREACFRSFLNNHYVGMGVFISILVGIYFQQPF